MKRRMGSTPGVCFRFGQLAERMKRRAEMAATEAGEGHWTEMTVQLGSYENAAAQLLRHHPGEHPLRQAVALAIGTAQQTKGRKRGVSDKKMIERATALGQLADAAASTVSRSCRV